MHFTVYTNDELSTKLAAFTKQTGKTRNTLICEALNFYFNEHTKSAWPSRVLEFSGIKEPIPDFESFRHELSPQLDKNLF